MFFDSHIHTAFSADAEMTAVEALTAAEKQGLGLVFTEHLDYDYPAAGAEEFIFTPEEYWAAYEPLRAEGPRFCSAFRLILCSVPFTFWT